MAATDAEVWPDSSRTIETIMHDNRSVPSFTYNTWSTSATVTDVRTSNLADAEKGEKGTLPSSLWGFLTADVDSTWCISQLIAFCFMTGYLDAIGFSAMFIWCGPQTGNTLQLAFALARLFEPSFFQEPNLRDSDKQALCSLIAFNLGVFLGRIGDRVGATKRIWQIATSFVQALFTMAAAIAIWKSGESSVALTRGDPAWTNTLSYVGLAFISLSLGLQGVQGKRLDTHFGTTIPLTTIWIELISDAGLLKLRQKVASRDQKTLTILGVFVGGFCGRALSAKIGAAGTLGIGVGIRVLIAISWIFIPSRTSSQ